MAGPKSDRPKFGAERGAPSSELGDLFHSGSDVGLVAAFRGPNAITHPSMPRGPARGRPGRRLCSRAKARPPSPASRKAPSSPAARGRREHRLAPPPLAREIGCAPPEFRRFRHVPLSQDCVFASVTGPEVAEQLFRETRSGPESTKFGRVLDKCWQTLGKVRPKFGDVPPSLKEVGQMVAKCLPTLPKINQHSTNTGCTWCGQIWPTSTTN